MDERTRNLYRQRMQLTIQAIGLLMLASLCFLREVQLAARYLRTLIRTGIKRFPSSPAPDPPH